MRVSFNSTSALQDAAKVEKDEDDDVSAATTSPSPTHVLSPPQQQPIPLPLQAQPALLSSPPQEQPTQPTHTSESLMTLLNTLIKTCATLTQKSWSGSKELVSRLKAALGRQLLLATQIDAHITSTTLSSKNRCI
nr:hypothetical protein [Tanacetum cinerariifolium]